MINNIHLQSFKCFPDIALTLSPLTLLSGLNSSGKSSVLQALRMWSRGELLPGHGTEGELRSSLGGAYKVTVTCETGEKASLCDSQCKEHGNAIEYLATLRRQHPLYFISASRLGPQSYLPLRVDGVDTHVGENGEYVVDVLRSHLAESIIPEKLRAHNVKAAGLRDNIEGWLRELSPGVSFQYHSTVESDIGRTEFSTHRPVNVGYGLSYVLPIVVSVLSIASSALKIAQPSDKRSPVLMIENPEAHLHPRGQTLMGRFLAYAASCGVQCIVETHSEHVLNGLRLAIKEGFLDSDKAMAYFFEYNFSEEKSNVQPIFFNEYGGCDNWPEGFFDESEKTLLDLV